MSLTIGRICDLGVGKAAGGRERNEDNFLVCHDGEVTLLVDGKEQRSTQEGEGTLLVVCDGMGGHADGHVAATAAVRVMAKLYQAGAPKRVVRVLHNYVLEAHRSLHRAARQNGPVAMGTTLTAAWIVQGVCAWVHVGDSRLYLFRGGQLFRLTSDHTRNEFARRDGLPVTAMGEHLAQNFIYGSRGLGDDASLRLDKGLDCGTEPMHKGDWLLLCTDGISGTLTDDELTEILGRQRDPQLCAAELKRRAIARGSRDNLTAMVVRIDDDAGHADTLDWLDDPEETVQF